MTEWHFVCPKCRARLDLIEDDIARCPADSISYPCVDGIWRLIAPNRLPALQPFIDYYEAIRRAEGWGAEEAAYYRALPFEDRSGLRAELWRVRAHHFKILIERVVKPCELQQSYPLHIVDVGAGNGWLAYRLAQRGHHVAAVDLLINERDGLGAFRYYDAGFVPMQADFDCLPLADLQADLIVFNGALHYSRDCATTLREAQRVAKRVVVIDSPFYSDEASGAAMLAEREASYAREYGLKRHHPAIGFLTERSTCEVAGRIGSLLKIYPTDNALIAKARRAWTRWRIGREPARFPLIVFERAHSI